MFNLDIRPFQTVFICFNLGISGKTAIKKGKKMRRYLQYSLSVSSSLHFQIKISRQLEQKEHKKKILIPLSEKRKVMKNVSNTENF